MYTRGTEVKKLLDRAGSKLEWVYCLFQTRTGFICVSYTKVITLTNHRGHGHSSKQIKTRGKYMSPTKSTGKHVRESRDLFWFYFWLADKVAWFCSPIAQPRKVKPRQMRITFDTSENCSIKHLRESLRLKRKNPIVMECIHPVYLTDCYFMSAIDSTIT